jgi:hypothetical protein
MGIIYSFKPDEPLRLQGAKYADPQKIGEALDAVAKANGGRIEPEAVVEAARDPANHLNKHFEWNDTKAAAAHRLEQARGIIRIVRVENEDSESGTCRAFFSITDERGRAYRPARAVISSASMMLALRKRAKAELEAFQTRYKEIKEISPEIDVAIRKLDARFGGEDRAGAA